MFLFASAIAVCSSTSAAPVLLRTDTGGAGTIAGSVFTLIETGVVDNGVTFDIQLTVTGSGTSVDNNTNGIGVDGTTLNAGQSLMFALTTSNVMGGTVTFDGFTSIDFNSFTDANELADFGTDVITTMDTTNEFDLTTLTGGAPTTFTLLAGTTGGTTSFQIDDITASFTASAVPEPSSAMFLAIGLVGLVGTRRRRRS